MQLLHCLVVFILFCFLLFGLGNTWQCSVLLLHSVVNPGRLDDIKYQGSNKGQPHARQ